MGTFVHPTTNSRGQKHPNRPLVIHTLSPAQLISSGIDVGSPAASAPEMDDEPPKKRRKLDNSTLLIPRLISVTEIIKREFLINVTIREEKSRSIGEVCLELNICPYLKLIVIPKKHAPPMRLHQYNYVGVVEDVEPSKPLDLEQALGGKYQ